MREVLARPHGKCLTRSEPAEGAGGVVPAQWRLAAGLEIGPNAARRADIDGGGRPRQRHPQHLSGAQLACARNAESLQELACRRGVRQACMRRPIQQI